MGGRVEISLSCRSLCPVVALSRDADRRNEVLTRCTTAQHGVVEEFTSTASGLDDEDSVEKVFSTGATDVYRLEHDGATPCPRERIESHGCPVANEYIEGDRLHLTLHADDHETVRAVVDDLRSAVDDVRLDRFVSDGSTGWSEPATVDLGRLTDRQRQTVETAFEMGYFGQPKEANASEVASELDIALSTFTEHLAAAQGKLFEELLGR
ncbi:helix-turn-helix domain-containing protein [Halostella litorea]|uniref:helix-turn-helix domain-containing protein n=1 Tax=Halostella litorea TaxID=2528831 RepID=UPI001092D32B|nr:helix-turn-helix domain-containing protein [Halostella litorea]